MVTVNTVAMFMKYRPEKDLPEFARQFKTLSPTLLAAYVLAKRNVETTPESITMYWKRHSDVYESLSQELKQGLPTEKQAVDRPVFENGNFRELVSVKKWIMELTVRGAKKTRIDGWVGDIRRICQGLLPRNTGTIEAWSLKHPDRLTVEDGKLYIYELKKRNMPSRSYRLALRNFLTSKDIVVKSTDISGELEENAGQYADLFVPKEEIYKLLENIKARNLIAYSASFFSYKTAARLTATLTADSQYINKTEHRITYFEKSEKGKAKKRVTRWLSPDLWTTLDLDHAQGLLFPIDASTLNEIIRQAMREVIPEIEPRVKMPFHFWRHMFAQHMLRATHWNYGFVAALGNWSVEALRKYYGKPDQETIDAVGREVIPTI